MKRTASIVWNGGWKSGSGTISTQSKILENVPYAFGTRFEEESGTNSEELIAAAHAACFSQALAYELEKIGAGTGEIQTNATLEMKKIADKWTISNIHLDVSTEIPGLEEEQLNSAANSAKDECIVSRALKTNISVSTNLGFGLAKAV